MAGWAFALVDDADPDELAAELVAELLDEDSGVSDLPEHPLAATVTATDTSAAAAILCVLSMDVLPYR